MLTDTLAAGPVEGVALGTLAAEGPVRVDADSVPTHPGVDLTLVDVWKYHFIFFAFNP